MTMRGYSTSRLNSNAGSVSGSARSIQPSFRSSILAPAQNTGPLDAITIARAPVAALSSNALKTSLTICRDNALRRSGSLSVMTAISPRISNNTFEKFVDMSFISGIRHPPTRLLRSGDPQAGGFEPVLESELACAGPYQEERRSPVQTPDIR